MARIGGIRIEYWLLGALLISSILSTVASALIDPEKADGEWWAEWFQGFSAEMMGAAVVFLILELVVSQMRFSELRHQQQARYRTNLGRASSEAARQEMVNEMHADDLLRGADLSGLDLSSLDLTQMDFTKSNLKGTNLSQSDMYEATLSDITMDADTILPDGSYWTPNADLGQFTHPPVGKNRRSENPQSPTTNQCNDT